MFPKEINLPNYKCLWHLREFELQNSKGFHFCNLHLDFSHTRARTYKMEAIWLNDVAWISVLDEGPIPTILPSAYYHWLYGPGLAHLITAPACQIMYLLRQCWYLSSVPQRFSSFLVGCLFGKEVAGMQRKAGDGTNMSGLINPGIVRRLLFPVAILGIIQIHTAKIQQP